MASLLSQVHGFITVALQRTLNYDLVALLCTQAYELAAIVHHNLFPHAYYKLSLGISIYNSESTTSYKNILIVKTLPNLCNTDNSMFSLFTIT